MRVAMMVAGAVAAAGVAAPAEATVFSLSVSGFITGDQFFYPCADPLNTPCAVQTPYSAQVTSNPFVVDLQEGANYFGTGNPFLLQGSFTGIITKTGDSLVGTNLYWSYDGCPGNPTQNCIKRRGGAATFAISVPEISSWAMMLTGFAVVGSVMRRRRHSTRLFRTADL